jgi:hypothetical protein
MKTGVEQQYHDNTNLEMVMFEHDPLPRHDRIARFRVQSRLS